ncbi:MAG: Lrp/AsnC family transcriptional regulator [Acidimicrobiales bacterium]
MTRSDAAQPIEEGPRRLPAAVDAVDLLILRCLAGDARLSQRRLAREVGMSAPAVADRLARLERLGVIRGYRVDIDWRKLGYPLIVYIGLATVQGGPQQRLLSALAALPEVEDAQVITGPQDILVRLCLRDHQHLREVLFERIWNLPGINRSESYISLGTIPPKVFDVDLIDALLAGGEAGPG